jgi:hypothetical protein
LFVAHEQSSGGGSHPCSSSLDSIDLHAAHLPALIVCAAMSRVRIFAADEKGRSALV